MVNSYLVTYYLNGNFSYDWLETEEEARQRIETIGRDNVCEFLHIEDAQEINYK